MQSFNSVAHTQSDSLGTLFIYFNGEYNGKTRGFPLYLNDTLIGYIKEGVKFRIPTNPGRISLLGKTWLNSKIYLKVESRKEYYFKCQLDNEGASPRPEIILQDSINGKIEYEAISYEKDKILAIENDDVSVSYFQKKQESYNSFKEPKGETVTINKPLKMYIGGSSGINNISGIIGPTFEYFFSKKWTAISGFGIGSWGLKFSAGTRFYFTPPHKSSINIFYTYVTGIKNITQTAEVQSVSGMNNTIVEKQVLVDLLPFHVFSLSYVYHYKIAGPVRGYFEIGYPISFPALGKVIEVKDGSVLTLDGRNSIERWQPGTFIIIGFGFNVGF
ncbi:MAG: hypothetical protein SFY32_03935 [Bacteroidota bacterium]|nr:hypothetical protein [Bacteroidota bacterium]